MQQINQFLFNNSKLAIPNGIYFGKDHTIYVGNNDGSLSVWSYSNKKNNFKATTDPSVSNDSTQGYTAESGWFNKNDGNLYFCESATPGAAVWVQVGAGGGGATGPFVRWGNTPPNNALGANGDGYILVNPGNANNGTFYQKSAGTYTATTQFGTSN